MSRRGEWDVRTTGTAHPQGLIAAVGDGIPVILLDDEDPVHALETMSPIQREVLRARLHAWAKAIEDYK